MKKTKKSDTSQVKKRGGSIAKDARDLLRDIQRQEALELAGACLVELFELQRRFKLTSLEIADAFRSLV